MSRIKWALVKSRLQYQFAEWPDTWPVKLSARHLARLQAVHVRMDGRVWSDEIKALQAAIDDATNAGELPCTIETFKFQYEAYSHPISASPAQQAQARKDACYQKDLAAISAIDFEHWLTTQGESPSIHIAAWVQSTTLTVDTAAPVPAQVIDYSLLATPSQLLDAFERWGMEAAWFDDLNSRKWLKEARRKKGQGQRGLVIEPLFCPFKVMTGMIEKVRRVNRLNPDTAWRTLEHKFPKVYDTFEIHDPRERTGD